jgi:alanine racemase
VTGRAIARVSADAIRHNCALLRERVPALCAVVKANGYGHGAAEAARAALAGGASWLAVATADEAAALRRAGIDARLLVMGALTRHDLETSLAADADVVAWTRELVEAAAARGTARMHVKLDSGMGRLGTKDPREARALCDAVAAAPGLELAGLMTHFATADERGDDHFARQLARFAEFVADVRRDHPGVRAHAANSAGTLRDPAAHFDLVRCGVAVYGLDPFGHDPADSGLRPALALESYVAAVKRFEPGESAGYGRTWSASEPTWVGVLPIGYGDGWRRSASNNADVLVRGRRRPLVGTVSMDNVTVDLGPETDVEPGDVAVLVGEQGGERILAEEVARRLGTINYEVTCGLSPRVRRQWLNAH